MLDQVRPQTVFVDTRQRAEALLVGPVRRGKKTRLPQQPLGAAIVVGIEARDEELFVSIDALPLPPELVVEPHHLGDEPGTQLKRRLWRPRPPSARRRYAG